ncbi:MAG: sodium/solute symporter, partial [Longimicrobiales bacterium]|nr:sodium/solute symporter [Longimicrobiales bacterium]
MINLSTVDITIFILFVLTVITIGLAKSRDEKDSESYFLAGRGLQWWLIGFSLIAANISTEQFVGMSGQAADYVGLAIASYEWMAAITLVVVAFFFLPKFLRSGVYTAPEFLRVRFNDQARLIMAVFTMIMYVGVTISAVIYSGALTLSTLFPGVGLTIAAWIIGLIAAVYVVSGGLKAVAWADLIQGSALILAGGLILVLVLRMLGDTPVDELTYTAAVSGVADDASGWTKLMELNSDKLHMVLPSWDLVLPWTALVVGLWIPNFYYWGLNQYIIQRTLGAHSLAEGQKGTVFAAGLKLLIPFVIVLPGIAAFNLFSDEMAAEAARDPQIAQGNQRAWERFEQIQQDPFAPPVIFDFDQAYAEANPSRAQALEAFNAEVREEAGRDVEHVRLVGYKYDTALPLLIGRVVPTGVGLQGFILAALLGAVVSSLASMLNAASTIFTMDLWKRYIKPESSELGLVLTGRTTVAIFAAIGCLVAPLLGDPKFGGIFTFIQEFQGFISPGILAVFLFGFFVPRANRWAGAIGLLTCPVVFGGLKVALPSLAFLDRMAVAFFIVLAILTAMTLISPKKEPDE